MKNKFGQPIDASFRPIFSTQFEDRRTNQPTYLTVEMQFYISVMFLGLPDDIHEEKPSFLQLKKTHYPRTDGPTDGQTLLERCEDASRKNDAEKGDVIKLFHLTRLKSHLFPTTSTTILSSAWSLNSLSHLKEEKSRKTSGDVRSWRDSSKLLV